MPLAPLIAQPGFGPNPLATVRLLCFADGFCVAGGLCLRLCRSVFYLLLSGCSPAAEHSLLDPRADCEPRVSLIGHVFPLFSAGQPLSAVSFCFLLPLSWSLVLPPKYSPLRSLWSLPSLSVSCSMFFSKQSQSPQAQQQSASSVEPTFLSWQNFCNAVYELGVRPVVPFPDVTPCSKSR